ncbi:MAG: glycosyltransferase family 4 protein [Spirochaetales bacterium]|nr:glycosyltransferase family 4 protein [Spirochaetales bacterium]
MDILYIQFAGNFIEAYNNFYVDHKPENYYAQKYTVSTVVNQARAGHRVTLLILYGEEADRELFEGLRVICLSDGYKDLARVKKTIGSVRPDKVILHTPSAEILGYLRKKKIPTFPVFADSFHGKPWYRIRSNRYLRKISRELSRLPEKYVANHQVNAARSLIAMGVPGEHVLAYDWEHPVTPEDWTEKIARNITGKEVDLFYAGSLVESKGIYDLIDAVALAGDKERTLRLTIAGNDKDGAVKGYLEEKQLGSAVRMLGKVSHDTVLTHMNEADLVVVPSHHAYPEGLPMTIMESLMTHTPVLVSDHPMFVGRVGHSSAVTFFKEKEPADLLEKVWQICADDQSYVERSENAAGEWHNLTLDLKWAPMIDLWLNNPDKLASCRTKL